jgi:hypothetical protein
MMEAQLCLLWADLSEPEPDAAEIARRAETLLHFATCLRDFPDLPRLLQTQYPRPPECFEAFLPVLDDPATG